MIPIGSSLLPGLFCPPHEVASVFDSFSSDQNFPIFSACLPLLRTLSTQPFSQPISSLEVRSPPIRSRRAISRRAKFPGTGKNSDRPSFALTPPSIGVIRSAAPSDRRVTNEPARMTWRAVRRQQAHGAHHVGAHNPTPPALAYAAYHSTHVTVSLRCCNGGSSSSRIRRRGSPFVALSDAYKPARAWLYPNLGCGGGEVVHVRSSSFVWPERLNPAADPRKLPRDISLSPITVPLHTADCKDESRRAHSTTHRREEERAEDETRVADAETRQTEETKQEIAESNTPWRKLQVAANSNASPGHRRRVTWSGTVQTREVDRDKSSDVFSPDLLALKVAKQLAVLTGDPELARSVEAVTSIRRRAAGVIRSHSARHDWNGSLDGLEKVCLMWTCREGACLRELDELVRQAVSIGDITGAGEDRSTQDGRELKATYREARRIMEDAESA